MGHIIKAYYKIASQVATRRRSQGDQAAKHKPFRRKWAITQKSFNTQLNGGGYNEGRPTIVGCCFTCFWVSVCDSSGHYSIRVRCFALMNNALSFPFFFFNLNCFIYFLNIIKPVLSPGYFNGPLFKSNYVWTLYFKPLTKNPLRG